MSEINSFCENLGSTAPTPGGGAAAGITLSLGAACAEKAARFSLKDDSNDDFINRFAEIREHGHQLCADDQKYFLEWQNARKLPKETEEEKKIRKEQVDKYAAECARVPLKLGRQAIYLIKTIEEFLPTCNKWLISDAAVGAGHAAAAFESSIFNIMINLPYVKDETFSSELKAFMNDHIEMFNTIKEKIYKKTEEVLQQ